MPAACQDFSSAAANKTKNGSQIRKRHKSSRFTGSAQWESEPYAAWTAAWKPGSLTMPAVGCRSHMSCGYSSIPCVVTAKRQGRARSQTMLIAMFAPLAMALRRFTCSAGHAPGEDFRKAHFRYFSTFSNM